MSCHFVLASQSPRRRMILQAAGLSPEVRPANADETPGLGEDPVAYALRVALAKADAVDPAPWPAVLAADTVVALDGAILGKARDRSHAVEMLEGLSGRRHAVHTAVVLRAAAKSGHPLSEVVTTFVRFRKLSRSQIEAYVDTGEPMDKAGAYGIQGQGGLLVAEVQGSYTNVIGLPLEETLRLLHVAGLS